MSNPNINILLTKKKRKKRKKKFHQPPTTPQPVVNSPMSTIAALFQLQQKLANKKTFSQDKPLTSGPRFSPNLKWQKQKSTKSLPQQGNTRFSTPQTTQQKDLSNMKQNFDFSQNASSSQNASTSQNSSNSQEAIAPQKVKQSSGQFPISSNAKKTKTKNTPKNRRFASFNPSMHANDKFHDCEVYDSPSFINFESEEAVADLNDDDICNKNTVLSVRTEKININKQDTQISFETKLQQQYAKKLESRYQETKNEQNDKTLASEEIVTTKKHSPQREVTTANRELLEALSSDFNAVVRDTMNTNLNHQPEKRKQKEPRHPAGVPKIKTQNSRLEATQPKRYMNTANNPVANNPTANNPTTNNPIANNPSGNNLTATNPTANDPTANNPTASNPIIRLPYDKPMFIQTDNANMSQIYSPSDTYERHLNEDSPEVEGVPRPSAFQRLGPPEKRPRLTINVSLNNPHSVREVVDDTQKHKPVYEKQVVLDSEDKTVVEFLQHWPWKNSVVTRKTVTARSSKTVMMMEKEYMEEIYDKDKSFFMITLEGYPMNWTKEDVLDLILEHLKGKYFVPCFIEFTPAECKFFVLRSKGALMTIHSLGFVIRKDNVELKISISQTVLTLRQVDFVPRVVLRSRISMVYDRVGKLDLSEFTLGKDISHFIYFPLHRVFNQSELVHLQSSVSWQLLTELNLSRNRITSIEGFCLENTTPKLKVLDLSQNCIESALNLLPIRSLHLLKLSLEGNPLCHDYIDPQHYIKVMKSIFSSLCELDGVEIVQGSIPKTLKNYCPEQCRNIVEKFLEVFFPLLEGRQEDRRLLQTMYAEDALMTVTHKNTLRYNVTNKLILNLLNKSRILLDGDFDCIQGSSNIIKLLKKWPNIQHDPTSFTVDVLYSNDTSIMFTINGILKITAETLAENESLLSFTRTVMLLTKNCYEYNIKNEMVYFDEPYSEWDDKAFQMTSVPKALCLKFDSPPDQYAKERLLYVYMNITKVDKKLSESYLTEKNWNIKDALELFTKVIKSSNIQTIH